jgi:hypothetical protein
VEGDVAVIHAEFKEVRIFVSEEGAKRRITLRPPFRASGDGAWLNYETPRLTPRSIDLQTVQNVQVVQRDGGRTTTVLLVGGAGFLAGFAAAAVLQAQSDGEGGFLNCPLCGPMILGIQASAISFLFVVPLTKYY